jgi:protein-S-isoprenylcysteine O-methyltransferase Ste14
VVDVASAKGIEGEDDITWRKGPLRQIGSKRRAHPPGDSTQIASEASLMAAWKQLRAILLLPAMVLLVIPGTILGRGGFDTLGLWRSVPSKVILPSIGIICVGVGLLLMVATIRLFVTVGQGTLAPWDPPQHLVVRGIYRHVRNPMISGVLFVLLGESLLTASRPLFGWFLVFALINAIYIPLWEEPGLVQRFGDEYRTYKRHVPRWVPRLSPWDRGSGHSS